MPTLTSDYRYCRLGDVDCRPTILCACADGEQHTILITEIHFLKINSYLNQIPVGPHQLFFYCIYTGSSQTDTVFPLQCLYREISLTPLLVPHCCAVQEVDNELQMCQESDLTLRQLRHNTQNQNLITAAADSSFYICLLRTLENFYNFSFQTKIQFSTNKDVLVLVSETVRHK